MTIALISSVLILLCCVGVLYLSIRINRRMIVHRKCVEDCHASTHQIAKQIETFVDRFEAKVEGREVQRPDRWIS